MSLSSGTHHSKSDSLDFMSIHHVADNHSAFTELYQLSLEKIRVEAIIPDDGCRNFTLTQLSKFIKTFLEEIKYFTTTISSWTRYQNSS